MRSEESERGLSLGDRASRRTKRSLNATKSRNVVSDNHTVFMSHCGSLGRNPVPERSSGHTCDLFVPSFFYIPTFILKVKAEPVQTPDRPAMSEEEVERKSKSIIDEFLHINDYKVLKVYQQRLRTLTLKIKLLLFVHVMNRLHGENKRKYQTLIENAKFVY